MTERSAEEINALVAKRLGWFNITKYAPPNWYGKKEKRRLVGSFHTIGADAHLVDIPDYCGKIEAAWEIVEKMSDDYEVTIIAAHRKYWCHAAGPTWKQVVTGEADTAPMAIALAFLKLPED